MEQFKSKYIQVLEWPSKSPDLNMNKNKSQGFKITHQSCSPSDLTEIEPMKGWNILSLYF